MKTVRKILPFILFVIFGIPFFIISLPFIILFYPIDAIQRYRFENKYAEFLAQNNGTNFFCYNNRKNSNEYINKNIIPHLNNDIEIIYLNGKVIESKYPKEFISQALYKLQNYYRFPHLMKIRNGKLIDKSVNSPFYNVLNLTKPKSELLDQINYFFK